MSIVARLLAILLMGAVVLALIAFPIALGAVESSLGAGAKDPPFFSILAPFLAIAAPVLWIGARAPTARIAWGRLTAIAAIGAFALPLEGFVGTALLGSNLVSNVTSPGVNTAAAHAGMIAGVGLATVAISGVLAFLGFFLGVILTIAAYLTLHNAPRPLGAQGSTSIEPDPSDQRLASKAGRVFALASSSPKISFLSFLLGSLALIVLVGLLARPAAVGFATAPSLEGTQLQAELDARARDFRATTAREKTNQAADLARPAAQEDIASSKPAPVAYRENAAADGVVKDAISVGQGRVLPRTLSDGNIKVAEQPKSEWDYSSEKDEMRGAETRYAQLEASNTIDLDFRYGEQRGRILVRQSPKFGFDVLVGVPKGQIMCSRLSNSHISVKFDDGPIQRFGCTDASDGSDNMVFIEGAKAFLTKLKKSKKAVIEVEFYQNGMQQMTFNTANLKWEN